MEKTFGVPVTVGSIALSASMIYVMPSSSSDSYTVDLNSGTVVLNAVVNFGSGARLNTAVNAIYATLDGVNPNNLVEFDISTGPITRQFDSSYTGEHCIFGPVWFSADGSRIYTGCGSIFRASKDPQLDMRYVSTLRGVRAVGAFAESTALKRVALLQNRAIYPLTAASDGVVMLFDSTYLNPVGQFMLPPFVVNGANFLPHGKWVFFNSASTEMYVLMEADPGSGLLNDWALRRIPLAVPASCGASFTAASANVTPFGSTGIAQIVASPDCIYQASTTSSWVQTISGGYGSGNGTLTYNARPNPTSSPRTAIISLGSQTFTLRQDGAPGSSPVEILGYNAIDAAYDKSSDRIIMVSSSPDELHIFDPNTQTEQAVPLAVPPLSVSVRPDGLYAAVGHDGWVSHVNLQSGIVEKII